MTSDPDRTGDVPPLAFPDSLPERATLELVARYQAGETEALGELYRSFHDELLFAVRARIDPDLRGELESEDVLRGVVVAALRDLVGYTPHGAGALRHRLHELIIQKFRERSDAPGAPGLAGLESLSPSRIESAADGESAAHGESAPRYGDSERYERAEAALGALPEDMRRVIVLRKIDGLPSREVAALLGKSDAAVRKLYSRALARLASVHGGEG